MQSYWAIMVLKDYYYRLLRIITVNKLFALNTIITVVEMIGVVVRGHSYFERPEFHHTTL